MPLAYHDDVEIYYETFGSPRDPCLLLINGLGSQCISYKSEWCQMFAAAGFFVIRFDNRDVGLSTKCADRPQYSLLDMAGDALAVLDAAGVDRAHVLGVSMGGMIVQRMAIHHPERLLSMTSVMSTTGDPEVGQSSEDAMAVLMAPPASSREEAVARYLVGIRAYGSPACYDEARLIPSAEEAYDRCFYPAGTGRQMMAVVADVMAGGRSEELRSVNVPALVLHGDQDRLIDISGGVRTADVIPGARFEMLEGMGHDYPPAYWDRIVQLVAEHALG